jgi:cell division protease FtsH
MINPVDADDKGPLSDRARDWWTPVITDFLVLLDSAVAGRREGIVVLGSTNKIGAVDPALLRPGRLEKCIEIRRPDLRGTINILRHHLNGEVAADLTGVARMMEGATGAKIVHVVRAARRLARRFGRAMTTADLRTALLPIEDFPSGQLFRMAVHEAAHAVVAIAIPVGIVKRVVLGIQGFSGGSTIVDFRHDDIATRKVIEDRVVVGLAARMAERIFTGAISTGGGGSIESGPGSATVLIAAIHASYGLGDNRVYLGFGTGLLNEIRLNRDLRTSVAKHLRELECGAERLVRENRTAIPAVAGRLATERYVAGEVVADILRAARDRGPVPETRPVTPESEQGSPR